MKSPLLFRRLFSLAFVFLASICQTRAVHIYLDTVSATPASQVVVTVRAAAFTQILSMQGTISWDPSVATFFAMESYGLPSMGIGNFGTSNTTNLNNGKLTFSWDDAGGTGITVPNGTPLFSIRFVTAAVAGTSTAVSLTGSPTPIEFIDLNLNTVQVTSQPGLIQVQSLTPPNDSCLHAIPIACGDTLAGSTLHATTDIAPTCDDAFNTSPGVWYAFTGDGGITTVSLCHSSTTYNSALSVFRGSCGNLICVAGNDNNCASLASEVTFDSDPGEVYLIFVHGGLNNPQGDFVISISCSYEANDACSQAIEITCGQALSGSTLGATNDTAPLCTTDAAAPGVWYYFIGNGQQATVSTCSSNTFYDTKILVYEGDCNTLLCVSGNDDDNLCNVMSTLSTVTFATDSGTVYFILVSGYNGETGEFDLSLTCEEPLPQECASPGKGISDTLVATLDTLPISGYTGFIRDLNVSVHIVHDYTGDLTIDLISPMGTIVKVYDQACGDPLMLVTYDDEGVINTCNTSPPNVQPSPGTLSDFDGENPNGIWIIRVVDNEPQDDGVLVKWCLQITTGECGIPSNCDDADACTMEECVEGICHYTSLDCDDGSLCTIDDCDPLQGCVYTSINCDDQNACTLDACDSLLGCVYTPVNCDDQNACTIDNCNPLTGCVNTPIPCADANPCTIDTCIGGTCFNIPKNCDDASLCTQDFCVDGACLYIPINCDDQNACTLDACDSLLGCVYTPVNCDDQNACTLDACDPLLGCVYTPVNCDDQNACTLDACDSLLGCVYTPVNCDDQNACTLDACDSLLGCFYTPVNCDDQNACTLDACDSLLGCVYTPVDCDDNNPCTIDKCEEGICTYSDVRCDDGNPCTLDFCDNQGNCVFALLNCDDDNACTVDGCLDGECFHQPVVCDPDADLCTIEICDSLLGCISVPRDCDDGNACTADNCMDNNCIHPPVNCDDQNACTLDACDSLLGCVYTPVNCDDQNACTVDACDPLLGCVYTPVNCDDQNACTLDACDSLLGCVYTPVNCDDQNACTCRCLRFPAGVCLYPR
ncbi:MAG: hypothetical protein KatS3mg031_0036 [Chitinophagales bacterium]|nr:MAG: hypothetical protein KatS3mg031_0036 [Chitinophagales bacterium]